MKRMILLGMGLGLAGLLSAYGVSPNQAVQGQPAQAPGSFQLQPGAGGPGANAPIPQKKDDPAENIKHYVPAEWAKDWEHIHIDDAKKFSEDPSVLFLDARAKVEYDQGHIPGAIPMPLAEFDAYYAKYASKIKKAKKLVTYCHGIGCMLSDKLAQKLWVDKKYRNVASFFGGWPQWQQANLPVETGPVPKKHN
jgi:rhodanese-related sulfurtransferase